VHDGGVVLGAEFVRFAGGGGGGLPQLVHPELVLLAEAHQQDAPRRQFAARIEHQRAVQFAFEVSVREHVADNAVQRGIDGAGRAAKRQHALEDVDDDHVRCFVLNPSVFDDKFHGEILEAK
jgi:hypothetical protein